MADANRRILIIEDQADIVSLLEMNLRQKGYTTEAAADGEAGLARFRRRRPDLVILDVGLPKLDGIEVCRAIRAASTVPILMLSERGEEVDRVLGIELGADDYVTKPFSLRELQARVKALLRRSAIPQKAETPAETIAAGTLEINGATCEVRVAGRLVPVGAKEFDLLRALASEPGRIHGREELLERIWGYKNAAELDTRTVDQHVMRLRRKLGAEGARLVTIKSRGYRFKA
jgi:DNA-binding response OmpR family regulator